LTPLKDVELPKRPPPPEDEQAMLATWTAAMERSLREGRPSHAVRLAHVLLRELPRHLATYYRLIRAAWMLRRWDEGDAWGRRLLRADPASALAWRGVAMAAEFSGERARAQARWRRAFDCDPFEPEIRAGLVRTSVDLARLPALSEAAHASLLLRGFRWEQAAMAYSRLTLHEPRRLDFQTGYLIALWQLRAMPDAYEMARRLVQNQPYLLAAWLVIDQEGDANDKALARHPLSTMDPDGDYARTAMGLNIPARPLRLRITDADKLLLDSLPPDEPVD
jgi:tetratricopeptide (TPR) repeat protein